jgi:hypothetical protein
MTAQGDTQQLVNVARPSRGVPAVRNSHPDAWAQFVRATVDLASRSSRERTT